MRRKKGLSDLLRAAVGGGGRGNVVERTYVAISRAGASMTSQESIVTLLVRVTVKLHGIVNFYAKWLVDVSDW